MFFFLHPSFKSVFVSLKLCPSIDHAPSILVFLSFSFSVPHKQRKETRCSPRRVRWGAGQETASIELANEPCYPRDHSLQYGNTGQVSCHKPQSSGQPAEPELGEMRPDGPAASFGVRPKWKACKCLGHCLRSKTFLSSETGLRIVWCGILCACLHAMAGCLVSLF